MYSPLAFVVPHKSAISRRRRVYSLHARANVGALRAVARRDANRTADQANKDGELSEDTLKSFKDDIQKLLKKEEDQVDKLLGKKQEELTTM